MTAPTELSIESVRNFMLANGGKVTNHDIVKHFKHFLTNPETRGKEHNLLVCTLLTSVSLLTSLR